MNKGSYYQAFPYHKHISHKRFPVLFHVRVCYVIWYCAVLCCAVLCCAVLCCAVLCCAVLCCAVLCCAVLCCAVLCCAVLCCAVLCCAVLCCAVLCCAVLCCAVLCCAVLCYVQWYISRHQKREIFKLIFRSTVKLRVCVCRHACSLSTQFSFLCV